MKIDGKEIAQKILQELKIKVKKLQEKNIIPHLVIVLVGDDPASLAYINQKKLKAEQIGVKTTIYRLPPSSANSVFQLLNDLNHLTTVNGIIVQRPVPQDIDIERLDKAIDPIKDVDGFHFKSKFQPPISLVVFTILENINVSPVGKNVVVLGKGETGGQPIIKTLRKMGINPTVIDSKTKNPEILIKNADIIISAVGKPNIVKPNMIKKGVVLISIGLHKGTDKKLHGDYEEPEIKNIASFYTPTPGGVGPINVAMLLRNLLISCENFSR